jgi:hypothetical protein
MHVKLYVGVDTFGTPLLPVFTRRQQLPPFLCFIGSLMSLPADKEKAEDKPDSDSDLTLTY